MLMIVLMLINIKINIQIEMIIKIKKIIQKFHHNYQLIYHKLMMILIQFYKEHKIL